MSFFKLNIQKLIEKIPSRYARDEKVVFNDHVNKKGEYSYLGACNSTITEGYGQLGFGTAVVFSTGYGDGSYPVYAEFDENGRVAKVVIDFLGEDDEY